ncbi:major facilitator superfamily domain-containing protein [Truncatella angustata]|uniref:Major facilitator superfamily domain-containing protein n=1 Tax=Truncatella angustata TaxID=152316 RepID=A0A9P8UUR4_9PEZI|nr:major facilitator superfamily domain-containing protein [Truncatella angustata]KAH6658708.1 major facilitator superfamily domain-containing protein [Truncatella angustata]
MTGNLLRHEGDTVPRKDGPAGEIISGVAVGHPVEQLEVDGGAHNDEVEYPTGIKLWSAMISIFTVSMLHGLDLTIVAATVPSVTNQFKAIEDIGWYSSAYSVMAASFGFFFGKIYGIASVKWLYLVSVIIFELGSLFCTVAPTSWFFILGRAIAGIGAAGMQQGSLMILNQCFPKHKRPMWTTAVGASQMVGIVSSPIVGGALIDWISWRGCFGINLPFGVAAILLIFFGFEEINKQSGAELTWKEKVKGFDALGTVLMVPSLTCLFIALQWGGIRFGWNDPRIVILIILFVGLLVGFGWRQHRLQEAGTLPPRILKMRSVLAGTWYTSCVNSTLAVTEYYITIYFQGVKGYTATQSGLLMLPMLVGMTIGTLIGGFGITKIGYYNPFMIATTILAPIASGLLTTIGLDDEPVKAACLLGFLGVAMGFGLQTPIISLQTTMSSKDLSTGLATLYFGATMGNAVWIVVSAALFQNRLIEEVAYFSPSTNATLLKGAGLSEIRKIVGNDRLRDVLLGYDEAVTQTLYLPLGLCAATIVGSIFTEWHSVKKKQE